MKCCVIYYSKTGNTKKLANSIADELGIEPKDVKKIKGIDDDSIVFLGSGLYANKLKKNMVDFICNNDFKGVRVALFGTSWKGKGKEISEMEKLLKPKGAVIKGKYFCKGNFFLFGRGHPSEDELNDARKFARKLNKI